MGLLVSTSRSDTRLLGRKRRDQDDDEDISLSNHRPLALVEVMRKVFTGVIVDRMRRDWSRLQVLDSCNPGFQAGRTTANAIYPLRTAAEHCLQSRTELAAMLDDL